MNAMSGWLVGGVAVTLVLLTGFAGFVAVWVKDPKQRADAYRVLNLVLAAVTGAGGVLAILLRLFEAGLL